MAGMIPTALFGLHVPCGTEPIPAIPELGPIFRITMAALDPTVPPNSEDPDAAPRATLRIIKEHIDFDDDEDDEDDEDDDSIDAIERRLAAALSDEEDEDESGDDGKNGEPSDPARSKKAKKEALLKALKEGFADEDEEEDDDDVPNGVNGVKKNKGKGKSKIATELEDVSISDVSISDVEDSEDLEFEEFVVCTLDTDKHYQQPLDITVGDDERVYFQVVGTHDIYLTGNYVIPPQDQEDDDDDEDDYDEDDYDLPPYEDEELSEDELDGLPDPRVEEVDSEEEAPKLIKAAKAQSKAKASKKRAAEEDDDEDAETLDNLIKNAQKAEPTTNGEQKLSKKQLKKLKNNQGEAVPAAVTETKPAAATSTKQKDAKEAKESPAANGNAKKVQFAKNLEQGPTPSPANKSESKKTGLGVKVVKGVTVDDKKLGSGRAAKPGDKIGMRYIGKLATDGKVFDANKKGAPFRFTLGKGEVIKGWDIGVEGITVGGERRITIPANLAYGSKAIPKIPANSTLVFDIKCLSIN